MAKTIKNQNFRETSEQKASRNKMEKARKTPKNLVRTINY